MRIFDVNLLSLFLGLVENLAVLFTFVIVYLSKFSIGHLEAANKKSVDWKRVLFFSLLICISSVFPIKVSVEPFIIIDLRMSLIILATVYLGPVNGFVTGLVTVILRYLSGGTVWVAWLPAALTAPFLTWALYQSCKNCRRTVNLIAISLINTLMAAVFALVLFSYEPLGRLFPGIDAVLYIRIYLPLLLVHPITVVMLDWAIKNVHEHHLRVAGLEKMVEIDQMTGIFNHSRFNTLLQRLLQQAKNKDQPLALLMLDLDNFKRRNDQYGHQVGDMLLKTAAAAISRSVRQEDIVARYGGEEFSVVLPNTEPEKAIGVAERIRQAVEESVVYNCDARAIRVTVSIGVACYPQDALDMDCLIRYADEALYRSKHSGKNQVNRYGTTNLHNASFFKCKPI